MKLMTPAAERIGPRGNRPIGEYLALLEQANVALSLDNLMTFPRLRAKVERGDIRLHGAYFGVATGQLSVRDSASGKFLQVAADEYAHLFARPQF
jgi:carbonic anhydrase